MTSLVQLESGGPDSGQQRVCCGDESTLLSRCRPRAAPACRWLRQLTVPQRCGVALMRSCGVLSCSSRSLSGGNCLAVGASAFSWPSDDGLLKASDPPSSAPRRGPRQASILAPWPTNLAVVFSCARTLTPDDRSSFRSRPCLHCCWLGVFRASPCRSTGLLERSPSEDGPRLTPSRGASSTGEPVAVSRTLSLSVS